MRFLTAQLKGLKWGPASDLPLMPNQFNPAGQCIEAVTAVFDMLFLIPYPFLK